MPELTPWAKKTAGDSNDPAEELPHPRRHIDPLLRAVMSIAEKKSLAHLYEEGRRRERWLEEGLAVSQEPFAQTASAADDLGLVAHRALRASGSALALIVGVDRDTWEVRTAAGALELSARERIVDAASLARDLDGHPAIFADPAAVFGEGASEKLGETLVVPLGPRSGPCVLVLARKAGAEAYTQADLDAAAVFGSHVDAALGLSEERRQRDEALISLDRDRIARDLHEVVIQRLFAAGLSLQSLRVNATPDAEERIARVTEELDRSIVELRSTIYSLSAGDAAGEPFTQTLLKAVAETVRDSTMSPQFNFAGRVDGIPSPVARQVLAVASEAVGNAVRHSGGTIVALSLTLEEGALELLVQDDGRGFAQAVRVGGLRVGGLARMRQRAASLGGTSAVDSAPGHGTTVRWRVQLAQF